MAMFERFNACASRESDRQDDDHDDHVEPEASSRESLPDQRCDDSDDREGRRGLDRERQDQRGNAKQ
jgi:hypothetical protein